MKFSGEVRQALVELGPATVRMIAARLDIREADYAGRERVRQAVRDLVEFRLAAKVSGPGDETWYAATPKRGARGEMQEKIWFAVRLKGSRGETFTRKDLEVLSGANSDYVKRYLHFLQAGGWIEAAGKVRMNLYGTGIAYRQVREKDQKDAPRWHRRAEEKKRRSAGRDACATIGAGDQGLEKDAALQVLAGVGNFVNEVRQILGETNVRVTAILDGMEADLQGVARGELPQFHGGGLVQDFPPGWDEARVRRVIEHEEKEPEDGNQG